MLLIIFLSLIAKLSFVSGDCDLGTPTLHDFDWNRFSGPRPWHILMHQDHGTGNNFDCLRASFASPEGNRSLLTNDVHDIREGIYRTYTGYITNWNSTGHFDVSHSLTNFNGRSHIIAVDYDRYFIGKHCHDEAHEVAVYVGYRSRHPEQETVNEVHRELQHKNVDVSQLVDLAANECPQAESSAAGASSV